MDFSGQWIITPLIVAAGAVEVLGMGGLFLYIIGSWLRPARSRTSSI